MADKGQQKAAYTFLAIAWGAVAVFKLFATHQFTDFAFGIASPGVGIQGLTRLAGFSSLAPAVAAYTLAVCTSTSLHRWYNVQFYGIIMDGA